MVEIIPAILTNDVFDFRKKYSDLLASGHLFNKLHIDFADGEFVPSKTLMPKDLNFLKPHFELMGHFMAFYPQDYFEDAKNAGFRWVIFHFEAFQSDDAINSVIEAAVDLGLSPGLAINPETPLHEIGGFLDKVSLIQLMGIHPGFQGKAFIRSTLDRIKELRALSANIIISVDGGIKVGVARACAKARADYLICGSAILRSEDKELALEALRADIET